MVECQVHYLFRLKFRLNQKQVSWSGISYLNNFKFTEPGLQVWRSYNIGPDKVVPYNRFSAPGIPEIKMIDDKARPPLQPSREERSIQLDAEDSDNEDSDNSQVVFTCTEDACTMTYIKLSALEKHIEAGKHTFYQEKESLLDMAKRKHANALLKEQGAIPKVSTIERGEVSEAADAELPKGWALKSSREPVRFNETQKQFLTEKFQIGEETGNKEILQRFVEKWDWKKICTVWKC